MQKLITDLEELAQPAEPLKFITDIGIDRTEVDDVVNKLLAAMDEDRGVVALSAPQLGIKKRAFCIRFADSVKVFLNPVITKKEGNELAPETFLSMPGKEIFIARPKEITAVYYNGELKYEDNKLIGIAARLFDQQAQLLDGVLPSDLGLVSDIDEVGSLFDADDAELAEIASFYKDEYLPKRLAALSDVTSSNDYRKLKFTEDVINGRSAVVAGTGGNRAQRRAAEKKRRQKPKQRKRRRSDNVK